MKIGNIIKKIIVLEIVKWIGVISLLMMSVIGNYIYRDYSVYIKNTIIFIALMMAMYVALTTELGRSVIIFGKESYTELQKVIWPTYQDSFNTTVIVFAVTVIISLILWGLDTILVQIISFGLRF